MRDHPAKLWPSNWLWHNRSNEPEAIQIVDLLHDIRNLLLVIALALLFWT